jgi:hypothetical protein
MQVDRIFLIFFCSFEMDMVCFFLLVLFVLLFLLIPIRLRVFIVVELGDKKIKHLIKCDYM